MYQALYRKYRPQTFDEVVGQEHITRTLKNQVMQNKLSHAYLFTGSRGTGKTSCAKILAKAVNCENPVQGNPCNHCAACRSIDSGACLDVLEIDAASNNGVDNVRVLRDDAIYTPSEVKKRVYIIDEVHMLSTQAFNALLKIIEEPPEHLIFILATTELHKVPATILSRCQRFSFRRLLPEDIAGRLNYAAYQENIAVEPEAIQLLARLADGALRDGLSLLDQCASATKEAVTTQSVYESLGLAGEQCTARLLKEIGQRNTAQVLELFSELYRQGKDLASMLDELCSAARDLLLVRTAPKSSTAMLSGICLEKELASLQKLFTTGELLRIVTVLQSTAVNLKTSANGRISVELCLIQLCDPAASVDLQGINARLSRVEETIQSGNFARMQLVNSKEQADNGENQQFQQQQTAKESKAERIEGPADGTDCQKELEKTETSVPAGFWPDLLAKLRPELPAKVKGFFAVGGPVTPRIQKDTLILVADSQFVKDIVGEPSTLQLVGEKASILLGKPVNAKLVLKGNMDEKGTDQWQKLLAFGKEHQDVITIK